MVGENARYAAVSGFPPLVPFRSVRFWGGRLVSQHPCFVFTHLHLSHMTEHMASFREPSVGRCCVRMCFFWTGDRWDSGSTDLAPILDYDEDS